MGAALLMLIVRIPPATGEGADNLSTFVETHRCTVVELLMRIHANPSKDLSRRFLILERRDAPDCYVQCAFDDGDHTMLCEAASGFFADPLTAPRITSTQKLALSKLGFSMDGSRGNFHQYLHIPSGPDNNAIANLLLTALYEGYGARRMTVIGVTGPFAMPHGNLPKDRCVPIS